MDISLHFILDPPTTRPGVRNNRISRPPGCRRLFWTIARILCKYRGTRFDPPQPKASGGDRPLSIVFAARGRRAVATIARLPQLRQRAGDDRQTVPRVFPSRRCRRRHRRSRLHLQREIAALTLRRQSDGTLRRLRRSSRAAIA
jgi:hypothetical protein